MTGDLELTIDPETRVATVSAIDGWKGNGEIVFTATDSAGHADTDTVVVVVRNPAPSIDLPDIFLQEGGSTQLSLDEFAEDDEAVDLLTWSATQVAGVPVSVDNVLRLATFTAAAGFSGMTAIRFEVTDAQGARGVDTVQVTVNAAPVVVGLPQLSLRSGFSAEILLDQHVLDDGAVGSITWSAHADSGLVVAIDSLIRVATVSTVAGFEGSTVIQFTAIDAQGAMGTGLMIIAVLPPPEAGDFDGDGRISLQDFFLLAEKQGLSDTHLNWNPVFDLDGDSKVDLEDFFRFADIFIANQRSTASP